MKKFISFFVALLSVLFAHSADKAEIGYSDALSDIFGDPLSPSAMDEGDILSIVPDYGDPYLDLASTFTDPGVGGYFPEEEGGLFRKRDGSATKFSRFLQSDKVKNIRQKLNFVPGVNIANRVINKRLDNIRDPQAATVHAGRGMVMRKQAEISRSMEGLINSRDNVPIFDIKNGTISLSPLASGASLKAYRTKHILDHLSLMNQFEKISETQTSGYSWTFGNASGEDAFFHSLIIEIGTNKDSVIPGSKFNMSVACFTQEDDNFGETTTKGFQIAASEFEAQYDGDEKITLVLNLYKVVKQNYHPVIGLFRYLGGSGSQTLTVTLEGLVSGTSATVSVIGPEHEWFKNMREAME